MKLTPEEIEIIIRQHNSARVKPSKTELALIDAQLQKLQSVCPEFKTQLAKVLFAIKYHADDMEWVEKEWDATSSSQQWVLLERAKTLLPLFEACKGTGRLDRVVDDGVRE